MGRHKLVLPWGDTTVIGQVVRTVLQAGLEEVVVVTGASHQEVDLALRDQPVCLALNSRFEEDQMILSVQTGLRMLSPRAEAALLCLGDQPQLEVTTVQQVLEIYRARGATLIIPSFQMRRGHPWLIDRSLWQEFLDLQPPTTMRDYLNCHADQITYVEVDQGTILLDLDTPEDYQKYAPL